MTAASGPGRRLGEDEVERIAVRYGEGASTRDVAREFGISPSSAQGVRKRLIEAGRLTQGPAGADAPGEAAGTPDEALEMTGTVAFDRGADYASQLDEAIATHEDLSGRITTHEARAAASRTAIDGLQRERFEVLARGGDALPLRARLRDAEDDLSDSLTSVELFTAQLAVAEDGITGLRTLLARQRQLNELDAAQAHAEAVTAATADGMRPLIDAFGDIDLTPARKFMELVQADQAAADRHAAAIEAAAQGGTAIRPGRLQVTLAMTAGDQRAGALRQAIAAALAGDELAVASALVLANGWQPPSAQEVAEAEAEAERDAAELAARQAVARNVHAVALIAERDRLQALAHRNQAANAARLAGKQPPPGEVPIGRDGLPGRVLVQRQWVPPDRMDAYPGLPPSRAWR